MSNEEILIELIMWILAVGLFLLYGFVQSIIINGIHAASAGDTTIDPDGKERDGEMILYPLRKFLLQYTMEEKEFIGLEYKKLKDGLIKMFPHINLDDGFLYNQTDSADKGRWIKMFRSYDPEIKVMFLDKEVVPYKEFKKYKFNKYIRKPIIQCIICMSSFWTLFLFWIPALCYFGLLWPVFVIGILNVFLVSYLSYLNYKAV